MIIKTRIDINPAFLGNRVKRVVAFLIDIFPISMIVMYIFLKFYGFQEIFDNYITDQSNSEFKTAFEAQQRKIGNISLGLYLIYAFVMECSIKQATVGKLLLGIKVINLKGQPPTPKEALWRNLSKIISNVVFSMGFIWILFDPQRRGWHDIIGKTLVVEKEYESEYLAEAESLIGQLEEIKARPYINTAPTLSDSNFHTLQEGNRSNLLFPSDIDLSEFLKISEIHPSILERLNHYKTICVEDVLQKNNEIAPDLLWSNSTYGQKLLRVFSTFDDYLNISSSYDFLFHKSEFIFAMIDVFKEIGADDMLLIYKKLVAQFAENMHIYEESRKIYEYPLSTETEKQSAYERLKSAMRDCTKFDALYCDDAIREQLYEKVCTYIENNPDYFVN